MLDDHYSTYLMIIPRFDYTLTLVEDRPFDLVNGQGWRLLSCVVRYEGHLADRGVTLTNYSQR